MRILILFILFLNLGFSQNNYISISKKDILPVQLVYFYANVYDSAILLRFGTATEVSNYGFEVQRGFNSKSFEAIGFVPGNGNSNSPKHYIYWDSSLVGSGSYYYRLKQIDTDGGYGYSDTVNVKYPISGVNEIRTQNQKLNLSVNPNPFNSFTKISFSIDKPSHVSLTIFNCLGNLVEVLENSKLNKGEYSYSFKGNNLSSGIYFCNLKVDGVTSVLKIVALK